jgi:hypothetical protein
LDYGVDMDFYFAELGNVLLAVFALAIHAILFLAGFATIIALSCRVANFILVDLSDGKRKLALTALITVDIVLVIAAIAATVSLMR